MLDRSILKKRELPFVVRDSAAEAVPSPLSSSVTLTLKRRNTEAVADPSL